MKDFARVTKLSNIRGRADYISNPERQESIVAKSEPVDWQPYHEYEQANQKTAAANNEGREVIIALPNEWSRLPQQEIEARAISLAETAVGKKTDLQWAVHWNKAHTNLHMHVIFSERQKEKNPGRWDRDIYLTDEGKIARRKADRAKNPDGTVKPPVHRKGEEKGGFTAKDTRYKEKSWVPDMKAALRKELSERWGVKIEEPPFLHEYHEGKGKDAPAIRRKNETVRINNELYKAYRQVYPSVSPANLKKLMLKGVKKEQVFILENLPDGRLGQGYLPLKEAREVFSRYAPTHSEEPPRQEPVPAARPAEPDFSFAALLDAQKEYYRQAFALKDDRKPLDQKLQDAPAKVKTALTDLTTAFDRMETARKELSGLKFWQSKEKKAKRGEYMAAEAKANNALSRLSDSGISLFVGGIKIDRAYSLNADRVKEIKTSTESKIGAMEREAHFNRQNARPYNALNGSYSRLDAARAVFEQECRKIPPAQKTAALDALAASEDGLRQGYSPADQDARRTVRQTAERLLSSPPTDRTKQQERQKGNKRPSHGRGR